jgi:hypothetical protein
MKNTFLLFVFALSSGVLFAQTDDNEVITEDSVEVETYKQPVVYTNVKPEVLKKIRRIGFMTGYSSSKILLVEDAFQEFNSGFTSLPGFHAGFFTEVGNHDYFTTTFGLTYGRKGSRGEDGYELKLDYIRIPLVFNMRVPITKDIAVLGGMGAYGSIAFFGKETSDGFTSINILSADFLDLFENDRVRPYSPFDFGLNFGGKVEYILPNHSIVNLGVNYDFGIARISNSYDHFEIGSPFNLGIKNRTLNITAAYMFNLNK